MEGDQIEPVEAVEAVEAMGFHRLPAVQTLQPRLPEAHGRGVAGRTQELNHGEVGAKKLQELELGW